uniref:Uncharacterized protein n=1 Tax=Podoviridae sp. ct8Lf7 TaxID=2827723 RepID=A0A8S5S294_9CAUD|nr:MAG TPA: hypothetical protein [Podoviridae sp. ct8Lf7]
MPECLMARTANPWIRELESHPRVYFISTF